MFFKAKHLLILAVVVSCILFSGFGCKGVSQEQVAATQPVSLEYWTVFDDVEQLNALIAKYTAERPYLKVTVRQLRLKNSIPG